MAEISVIVPARNAEQTIGRTIAALAAQDFDRPFEVVVVDNGSSDRTAEIARAHGAPIRVITNEPPSGAGAARNAGVRAARAEVLAFTDADCFPERRWLSECLAALGDADLLQGAVSPDPNATVGPFDRTVSVDGEAGLYETANLTVRRSLFERLGGFEDWLGSGERPIGEDLWFGWRARRTGARTAYAPRAQVDHAVFARGPVGYTAERARLVHFPRIAAKIPELRDEFFHHRFFLNRRSAAFDLALAGVVLAARSRSPLPLLVAIPYARLASARAQAFGARAPAVTAADLIADSIGLVALLVGSLRARSPLF
ncbi:MAG: glycosyltransferase [Solirubrobacterales bacterium]